MPGICNNATMLFSGDHVVFTRFEKQLTRQLFLYHSYRPLGHCLISWTPIFVGSSWFNLLRARMGPFTLLCLCNSENGIKVNGEQPVCVPMHVLESRISELASGFAGARLDIPSEPPPVLLRQFAPRETFILLFRVPPQGLVVFPQPRPMTELQLESVMENFWVLLGQARTLLTLSTKNISISRDIYHFVALCDSEYELFVLFAAGSVSLDRSCLVAQDILKSLIQNYINCN